MDSAGTLEAFVLLLAFVAALYASVGHGGASGYLAVMALFGVGATVMRPSALVLNVLVSMIATLTFALAGQVRWRMLLPFIVTSVPMAFLGGTRTLPDGIFRMVVAIVLVCVAVRLFIPSLPRPARALPLPFAIVIGAVIGALSGLVGVGGGIFLTPLLILGGWSTPREAAALSAPFILVNSIAGLGGMMTQGIQLPPWMWWACGAVVISGWIGAQWSVRGASQRTLRLLLGLIILLASVKFALV
ncbi:MAG: sulfite exporter TauE/SafE family protein [Planctomycetota bacterium]|nr:sulfite exporter TauE/SafE family protein [Planctomycetota bacterium]